MPYYPFTLPLGTALHWAVTMSVPQAVISLLNHGAKPSVRDGSDPYRYDKHVRDLDMLVNGTGISIPSHITMGLSAIDVSVKNRDHKILELLLSDPSHNDIDDVDEEGHTALHRLDAGEWLHTKHGSAIWNPLFQGIARSPKEALRRTVAILVKNGYDLDKMTSPRPISKGRVKFYPQTALMLAVAKGQLETVETLVGAGADVDVLNNEGRNAITSFSDDYSWDHPLQSKMLSTLLSVNPNLNSHNIYGNSVLIYMSTSRLFEGVQVLLERGINPSDRNMSKYTFRGGLGRWTMLAICSVCPLEEAPSRDDWLSMILNTYVLP